MNEFPLGWAAGLWTALSMTLFIVVVIWAYSKRNRGRFDEAARLAVDEVPPQTETDPSQEQPS